MTHKIVGIAPRLRRPERVADQRVSALDVKRRPRWRRIPQGMLAVKPKR